MAKVIKQRLKYVEVDGTIVSIPEDYVVDTDEEQAPAEVEGATSQEVPTEKKEEETPEEQPAEGPKSVDEVSFLNPTEAIQMGEKKDEESLPTT